MYLILFTLIITLFYLLLTPTDPCSFLNYAQGALKSIVFTGWIILGIFAAKLIDYWEQWHLTTTTALKKKKSLPLPQLPLTTYKSSKKYGSSGTFQTIWQAACRLIGKSCADNPTFLEWKWCVFCRTCVFIVLCLLFGFVCLYFF